MAVLKYKDPTTGEVKTVGAPKISNAPTYVSSTMLASSWVDNTYSFESTYPHVDFDISIEVAPTATVEQFEAFGEAMVCGSATSNVATALNGAPTVDIPILIKVVGK